MDRFVVLDIETENTGYDVMAHNKRVISVQLFDGTEGKLFYDGSEDNSIAAAKTAILSHIDRNDRFVGFNVRNFDATLLNKFLGIAIPSEQIVEISEMPKMDLIRRALGRNYPSLVETCKHLGVDCSHKKMMDDYALTFRNLPDVLKMVKEGAAKMIETKGWTPNYAYNRILEKITGGMAILESFNEFVIAKGDVNSLFHKYAMGDVLTEYRLFEELQK